MTALKLVKNEPHAIKIEDMDINVGVADEMVAEIKDWLDDLNFSKDRIEEVSCRRVSGFIPFSHNKGGISGRAYRDQYSACQNTGFENTDAVLTKYSKYAYEAWLGENKLDINTVSYQDLTCDQQDALADFEYEYGSDDTIEFQARVMFTSATTANVDFYVSASDTPYHRQSDDKLEVEIKFKSPAGLRKQLNKLSKTMFVKCLAKNVRAGY